MLRRALLPIGIFMPSTVSAPPTAPPGRDLSGHPAVEEMARELLGAAPNVMAALTHEDGTPTSRLMYLVDGRFADGTGGTHRQQFLTVAHAVLARLDELRADVHIRLLAALPDAVTESRAAELEARQAIREMWAYGFSRCPLTRYAEAAGRAADAFTA